jgi:hypothetical protein
MQPTVSRIASMTKIVPVCGSGYKSFGCGKSAFQKFTERLRRQF